MRDYSHFQKDSFQLGGLVAAQYNVIVLEPPKRPVPVRDVERVEVPGRSGDLVFDRGRYRNVMVDYKCVIVPDGGRSMRDAVTAFANAFASAAGYQPLTDTFDSTHFTMARVSEEIDVESIVERAGRFTITFDSKPQRYLLSGQDTYIFNTSGDEVYNDTRQAALPLITVLGSGAGVLTVQGVPVEIKELSDQITLDCESQNAYRQAGEGGRENKNGSIYAPIFPALKPGRNGISWTGGISSVEIIPRWWEL